MLGLSPVFCCFSISAKLTDADAPESLLRSPSYRQSTPPASSTHPSFTICIFRVSSHLLFSHAKEGKRADRKGVRKEAREGEWCQGENKAMAAPLATTTTTYYYHLCCYDSYYRFFFLQRVNNNERNALHSSYPYIKS